MPVLLVLLLVSCTPDNTNAVKEQASIVYALTASVSGIDPHIHDSREVGMIIRQIYDTLVYRDARSRGFVPGLATSWVISDDQLVYTFTLREDVFFHDGTRFDAEAVSANFSRVLNPNITSPAIRSLLGPIISYQVIDAFTFRVTLSEPYEPLLDGLSQPFMGIASPAALTQYEAQPLRYQYHQVGTGPFVLQEYVPEDRIVLIRNQDYLWGPVFYEIPIPENAVNQVIFRFYQDPQQRFAALRRGSIDITGGLRPEDAERIAAGSEYVLQPVSIAGETIQFMINTEREPTNNLAVRQALLYATNRASIVDGVYRGFTAIAWGPLSTSTLYYNRGVENAYSQNIVQAQDLLRNAGYSDADSDGILDYEGENLKLTVLHTPWDSLPQVTTYLSEQWASIGIETVIEPIPGMGALAEAVTRGDYNLVPMSESGLDASILSQNYFSGSLTNWSNFRSTELDDLLMIGRQTNDAEERRQVYGRAQAIILEQAITLPISERVNLNAYAASIDGLMFDPIGWYPLLHNVTQAR
jgi:peptide/nickel transport system substrate-binding protein